MLEELLASPVYNGDERPPSDGLGIYPFTEQDRHLYVGRTRVTARARAGRTSSGTSFRSRFDAHTQPARPPGTAPFANRLMHEAAEARGIEVPPGWWDRRGDEHKDILELFVQAKQRIAAMECRVVGFLDDARGVRSTVAETYVHALLGTPYNYFLT